VVLLLVVAGVGVWWFLLRGESPEDGVDKWFAARSCRAFADRMTGTALHDLQPELDAGSDSDFCSSLPDFSEDYDITSVDERGDRATVDVKGTQHYDGSDDSIADERDFTVKLDLRLIDGEWLVSNADWHYVDQ
jgi:hypothetical protein